LLRLVLTVLLVVVVVGLLGAGWWLYTPDKPRAELERIYHVGAGDSLAVAGITLHLRDEGRRDAPAVLLLHGFGSSLETWDAWARDLSADHRVLRLDLPGFGLTGPDPTGDYSDARAMRIIAALLDRLGIARVSLVGNSLGGRLAWMFAATFPDRVDRLVLVSPDGFASPGFAYGKAPDVPLLLRALPYTLPRAMLRASLVPAYGDPHRLSEATVTRYYDMMLAPGVRRAILARTSQTILQDPLPMLRRIRAPTLLLWGEKDGMIPFSNSDDYLRAIPGSKLVALPGLGHVPFEEAPELSLQPVRPFLDEEPSPPGRPG
jgi:pimeloyl-ACP methyl ester carboxylesterase